MKKLFLVGALALGAAMNAQTGFKLGVNAGMPIGDTADGYSFAFGLDAAYLYPINEKLSVGGTAGFTSLTGKTVQGYKVPSMNLIPVAATAQYKMVENFSVGLDLGYAFVSMDGGSDSGLYFQPKVAYHINNKMEVYAGFKGAMGSKNNAAGKKNTINLINLGFAYSL